MGYVYAQIARYYDKIYGFKDYASEAQRLRSVVDSRLRTGRRRLLDVACGTGLHLEHLRECFDVEGLDVSPEMLEVARQRNPGVLFHQADMTDFDLGRSFDVVTCLFSSIGYVRTADVLGRALSCMSKHLVSGGLLIVEPWFTPDVWHPNNVHMALVDEPELKIARVNTSFVDGRLSYFDLHYLIGTPDGTEHMVEHHELGLFETEEMLAAMTGLGLSVTYDKEGLSGRGLFVALRP